MRRAGPLLLWMMLACGPVWALDLNLPASAAMTREVIREADTVILPTGPYSGLDGPRLRLDGRIVTSAWRFQSQGITTLQILTPLRDQLETSGWDVLFECATEECGGFDFRFALPVLPAPDMFVDLFEYRYLVARRGSGSKLEHVALIVSQSGQSGYVQIVHATPTDRDLTVVAVDSSRPDEAPKSDMIQALHDQGHVVLDGLDFGSGANTLGPGPHPSLNALSLYLLAAPNARVALVGHTDSTGGLEANIALSRARAEAVRNRLMGDYGVPAAQIEAHGIGYLAPIAPNTHAEGRDRNRRVEVVLLSSEMQ
ncbi:OmpA family protein [Roseovarius sp.]|uniref:OmpA family protein n=1 Tax=Roseovarius sp. TaxID=1486281 RepID=UPI003A96E302